MHPYRTTRCYSDAWLTWSPLKGQAVLLFVKLLLPVIAGGAAGAITMVGVVSTQTAAPETNPANQQILTYGD